MKYIFILLPMLISCSFYLEEHSVTVSGCNFGHMIVSSKNDYQEISLVGDSSVQLFLRKGDIYYISYFPEINNWRSRYPLGAIVLYDSEFITLSPHLGLLTMECNQLNFIGESIEYDNMLDIRELFLLSEDPWIFDRSDTYLCLMGEITKSSISKFRELSIPELSIYYNWIPENRLFSKWYPSIQTFYNNKDQNIYFRLEIYEDGSYYGFSSR